MRCRSLGRDGPRVPVIGLGAWPIGGGMGRMEETEAVRTVRGAIDAGVTLVDTAQAYGPSEAIVGKALRDGYRQRCFLATKVSGDYSPAAVRAAMENSLRALGVDHVDLYQVHSWRGERDPIEATMAAMARLQEEGKTRYLGVSNFNAAQMEAAASAAPFVSSQPCYNMLHRQIETADLPWCLANGVGNLAHSPLAKGLLSGRYSPGHVFPDDDERSTSSRFQGESFARCCDVAGRLGEIAAGKGLTLVQMAIAWCLRQPAVSCVLVGAKSLEQVQEHLGAAEVSFDAGELARIDAILQEAP